MSETSLLKPREVDRILRYPKGRTQRLAKAGRFEHLRLPDGEIRIPRDVLTKIMTPVGVVDQQGGLACGR